MLEFFIECQNIFLFYVATIDKSVYDTKVFFETFLTPPPY